MRPLNCRSILRRLLLLHSLSSVAIAQNILVTSAGTDWVFPGNGRPALQAPFGAIQSVTMDPNGRIVFADPGNAVVVRIDSSGSVTVLAGNGLQRYSGDGGLAVSAALNTPSDAAYDGKGNLYIADYNNNRVRMVSPDGTIKTVAGSGHYGYSGDNGPAVNAALQGPAKLTADAVGNVYFVDSGNYRVRRIAVDGTISTVVGNGKEGDSGDNGPAAQASFSDVEQMALDSAGNLYLSDFGANRIRKVDARSGIITTIAGTGKGGYTGDGGPATKATLNSPGGVFVDSSTNIYISDTNNFVIRKVDPQGVITTVAGAGHVGFSDGSGSTATFAALFGLTGDSQGNVFVADRDNYRVRQINAQKNVSTLAGSGTFRYFPDGTSAANAFFFNPSGVSVDGKGNIYVADTDNNRIRLISPSGMVSTFAGNGTAQYDGPGPLPAKQAGIYAPTSVTLDNNGNVYVADTGNACIRKISPDGMIITVAGNGNSGYSGDGQSATKAQLGAPEQVVLDTAGNLYIADWYNNMIRKVNVVDGKISTYAGTGKPAYSGDGKPAAAATLNGPSGLVIVNGKLYIADTFNSRIRAITLSDPNSIISTVAGGGTLAVDNTSKPATQVALGHPIGLIADPSGNIFFSDGLTNQILEFSTSGMVSVIAGNGKAGFSGDGGSATQASFNYPYGMAFDSAGDLLIADAANNRIRTILAKPPSLQLTPMTLSFSATAAGALTDPQSISIASSVPGLIYSIGLSTCPGGWLQTDNTGGTLPAAVQVYVDPTTLQPGTAQCNLQVTAPGVAPVTIAVNVAVAAGAPPQLSTNISTVNFSFTNGAPGSSQGFSIKNTGGGTLNFTATVSPVTGGNWLAVSPAQGKVTAAAASSVALQASPGTLDAGTYQALLSIQSDSGQSVTVPVFMTVSSSQQTIVLSQTAMKFTAVANGGPAAPQRLTIANGGQGSLGWSAQSSVLSGVTADGSPWLALGTTTGNSNGGAADTPYTDVTVNANGLAAGEYYGKILVSAPNAANSPLLVTVVLEVLLAGSDPGPDVSPTGLIFTGVAGTSPSSQFVSIRNPSAHATNFAIGKITSDGQNWIIHAPTTGTSAPGQPSQVVVQPDFSSLSPGTYNGVLTFVFGQGTVRTVNVTSIVLPPNTTSSILTSHSRISPEAGSCKATKLLVTFQNLAAGFSASIGVSTPVTVIIKDDCGVALAPISGSKTATISTIFSNGDKDLQLGYSNGVWTNNWTPVHAGSVKIDVSAFGFTSDFLNGGGSVIGTARSGPPAPLVTPGGIVHAASFVSGLPLAPGSLITVKGANLCGDTASAPGAPLPVILNGSMATLGLSNLNMEYCSAPQINGQVPFDVPINTEYQITVQRDNMLSVPERLLIAEAQPGIFTTNASGSGQGTIFKSDGITFAQPGTPATAGEVVTIYCTGLGAVTPNVPAGVLPDPTVPMPVTTHAVTVSIGGQDAPVVSSTLSPSYVGVYLVNATVPSGVTGDTLPVTVTAAGQTSAAVTIAVQ